jgi:uncharacterized membrane protein
MSEVQAVRAEDATAVGKAEESERRFLSAERLVFFSDAVVAIAITLLALELHVPEGTANAAFWHDMRSHLNDYLAFLISFAVIGNYWFVHHRIFGYVTRLNGPLMRWNMLWLLMIVLTPFATKVIVGDEAFAARFTVYALVQALASGAFMLAIREMDRRKLVRDDTPRLMFTRSYQGMSAIIVAFLVSIPLAYATHWAYVCWLAIPVVGRVTRLVRTRRWRRSLRTAS